MSICTEKSPRISVENSMILRTEKVLLRIVYFTDVWYTKKSPTHLVFVLRMLCHPVRPALLIVYLFGKCFRYWDCSCSIYNATHPWPKKMQKKCNTPAWRMCYAGSVFVVWCVEPTFSTQNSAYFPEFYDRAKEKKKQSLINMTTSCISWHTKKSFSTCECLIREESKRPRRVRIRV